MAERDPRNNSTKDKVYPKGVDEEVLDDAVSLLDKAIQTATSPGTQRTKVTAPLLRGDAVSFIRNAPTKQE